MKAPLSVTTKLIALVVCAVLFAMVIVGLSFHGRPTGGSVYHSWTSDKDVDHTFNVQPGGDLILDAAEGNITVTGTDGSDVVVHVIAHGSDDPLRHFDVSFEQDGNTVKVSSRHERRYFRLFENNSLDVKYMVEVPHSFNLDLKTSGGDITVSKIKGKIDGETSGGDLDISSVEGVVRMSTSGGNVNAANSSGDFDLGTSGGSMEGKKLDGPIHMETSGGNIELRDCNGKLYATTSGGNIEVTMEDNKGIELSTSGGNVTVRLPRSASGDVAAEASGGDVNSDFPFSGKIKEGRMNGKINGGGPMIKLETSGGDIAINSMEPSKGEEDH